MSDIPKDAMRKGWAVYWLDKNGVEHRKFFGDYQTEEALRFLYAMETESVKARQDGQEGHTGVYLQAVVSTGEDWKP